MKFTRKSPFVPNITTAQPAAKSKIPEMPIAPPFAKRLFAPEIIMAQIMRKKKIKSVSSAVRVFAGKNSQSDAMSEICVRLAIERSSHCARKNTTPQDMMARGARVVLEKNVRISRPEENPAPTTVPIKRKLSAKLFFTSNLQRFSYSL